MPEFEIELWGERATQEAATRSKSRYHFWLRYLDVFSMTFGDYLQQVKIRRVKCSETRR
mgnify:CR=1 FL=1